MGGQHLPGRGNPRRPPAHSETPVQTRSERFSIGQSQGLEGSSISLIEPVSLPNKRTTEEEGPILSSMSETSDPIIAGLTREGVKKWLELEQEYLSWRSSPDRPQLIHISEPVHPNAIPLSAALMSIRAFRTPEECMRIFGETQVRDKFLHSPIEASHRLRCGKVLEQLFKEGVPYDDIFFIYSRLPRYVLFNYRKRKGEYLKPTVAHLKSIIEWYKSDYFPISDKEPKLRKMLDDGMAYWKGRDMNERPILVLRPTSHALDPTTFERLITFLFEWARRYLFIPAVSETAVVWFDLTKVSLLKAPFGEIQAIVPNLTRRYPFHLDNFYVIHDSIFIQTVTPIVRSFMTELQKLKIRVYRRRVPPEEMSHFDVATIESQYGGMRQAITRFYPFPIHTSDYSDPRILKVFDSVCIEGMPLLVKEIPLSINDSEVDALIASLQRAGMPAIEVCAFIQRLQQFSEGLPSREGFIRDYGTLPLLDFEGDNTTLSGPPASISSHHHPIAFLPADKKLTPDNSPKKRPQAVAKPDADVAPVSSPRGDKNVHLPQLHYDDETDAMKNDKPLAPVPVSKSLEEERGNSEEKDVTYFHSLGSQILRRSSQTDIDLRRDEAPIGPFLCGVPCLHPRLKESPSLTHAEADASRRTSVNSSFYSCHETFESSFSGMTLFNAPKIHRASSSLTTISKIQQPQPSVQPVLLHYHPSSTSSSVQRHSPSPDPVSYVPTKIGAASTAFEHPENDGIVAFGGTTRCSDKMVKHNVPKTDQSIASYPRVDDHNKDLNISHNDYVERPPTDFTKASSKKSRPKKPPQKSKPQSQNQSPCHAITPISSSQIDRGSMQGQQSPTRESGVGGDSPTDRMRRFKRRMTESLRRSNFKRDDNNISSSHRRVDE